MQGKGYLFKSDLFEIVKGEDDETNPGCYGKSLSDWLSSKLSNKGYSTEIIPEDWGWCVMCSREDMWLWVGCGTMILEEYDDKNPPLGSEVRWTAFPVVETPLFKPKIMKWLGKLDINTPLNQLDNELRVILNDESRIQIIEE